MTMASRRSLAIAYPAGYGSAEVGTVGLMTARMWSHVDADEEDSTPRVTTGLDLAMYQCEPSSDVDVRWSSRGWRGVSFGEMDRGVVPGERWGEQRTCSKMSLASIVIQGRWGHRTANDEVEESSERLSRRNQGSITQFEKAQGSCQAQARDAPWVPQQLLQEYLDKASFSSCSTSTPAGPGLFQPCSGVASISKMRVLRSLTA